MRDSPMQRNCSELAEKLLKSLDKEYNVLDMRAVVDVITALEKTTITKEVLEITRLGKHINELRRKTSNDALAKRAKDLVRRWRDMVLPSVHSTPQPTLADTAPPALNGAKEVALRNLKPQSPALRGLKPHSPLLKDATQLKVLSPALSVHSDHSRSPNASSNKQSIQQQSLTSNHRLSSCSRNASPVLSSSSQNHTLEAVPRTHSSNKRLRKEENSKELQGGCQHYQSPLRSSEPMVEENLAKKQRLNGENISGNLNSQVPSPTLKERISSERLAETSPPATDDTTNPKKRGRKKGSKSTKRQPFPEDSVKEKLASISRNPKLKTTQELLADLQARGSNCSPVGTNALASQSVAEPPSIDDMVLRGSSNEQVSKYTRCSQKNSSLPRGGLVSTDGKAQVARSRSVDNCHEPSPEACRDRLHDQDRPVGTAGPTRRSPSSHRDLTVEEILAKLPPLDPSSIDWGDYDPAGLSTEEERNGAECSPPPREVTAEDLERLHTRHVEGLNGNFQPRLPSPSSSTVPECCDGDRVSSGLSNVNSAKSVYSGQTDSAEFREWHQILARPSYQGETLHIMPYVIID
ncbi:mediator of RNA polymerase II transcription subunit 26 isoform X1 [Ooceraea biroi]|uniref:Mediator of RNA polymerase II transcription subunit 26 n=1 Tax=Ooceraea biroi TaxID=2015173 RepID=A0A026WED7_OOCBI|nr:mediator of RNA polymerase II transcription subunit 26 isoform X1 [Ooceraea biroi]EZA54465.1 Mediator of RNA polymerase II transcription subunit [Ooceraea biroi]